MIDNLRDLNDKVNDFVNYVVQTACEKTTSGQYYVSIVDACKDACMSLEDFSQYRDLIVSELYAREELLELDYIESDLEFDVNCGLAYCPSYQWCDGDEDIFNCSFEEWLDMPTRPISQPLSLSRKAGIADAAVKELKNVSNDKEYYKGTFIDNLGFGPREAAEFGLSEDLEFVPRAVRFYVGDGINFDKEFDDFSSALSSFKYLTSFYLYDVTLGAMLPDDSAGVLLYSNKGMVEKGVFDVDGPELEKIGVSNSIKEYFYNEVCPNNDFRIKNWRLHVLAPGEVGNFSNGPRGVVSNNDSFVELWDMSNAPTRLGGKLVKTYSLDYFLNPLFVNSFHFIMTFGLETQEAAVVQNWLNSRSMSNNEKYFTYHGEIDVPYDRINEVELPLSLEEKGQFVVKRLLDDVPFVRDVTIETAGEYNNGLGYTFTFNTQANPARVNNTLPEVFKGFNYEAEFETKIVGEKEPLNDVICSCEEMSKKGDVVDLNEHQSNREDR